MAKYIIRDDEGHRRAKLTLANILRGKVTSEVFDRFAVQEAITDYEIITRKVRIPSGMKGYSKYVDLINRAKRLRNTSQTAFRKGFSEENFLTIEIYNNLINVLHTYHNSVPPAVTDLREYPGAPPTEITIPTSWRKKMAEIQRKKSEAQKPKPRPKEKPVSKRDEKKIKSALEKAKDKIRKIRPK